MLNYLAVLWFSFLATMSGFFATYWPVVVVVVALVAYYVLNRQLVKKLLLQLMIQVEKRAAELALEVGKDKMQFVIDKAYVLLPRALQILFPKAVLTAIAQSVYNDAKAYLDKVVAKPVVSVIPDETIDQLADYVYPKLVDALTAMLQAQLQPPQATTDNMPAVPTPDPAQ